MMKRKVIVTTIVLVFGLLAIVTTGQTLAWNATRPTGRQLMREGSLVTFTGTFQGGGVETVSFRPVGREESYAVLQNLALQRVARAMAVNKRRQWEVMAEVTEFDNANYLLLKRVVLKGKTNPGDSIKAPPTKPAVD